RSGRHPRDASLRLRRRDELDSRLLFCRPDSARLLPCRPLESNPREDLSEYPRDSRPATQAASRRAEKILARIRACQRGTTADVVENQLVTPLGWTAPKSRRRK